MSGLRAVVFDLDGTLIHSAPSLHHAMAATLAEIGRPTVTLAQVTGFIGNGVGKLVARSLDATGGPDAALAARAQALFMRHYAAAPASLTTLYPGAVVALESLAAAGLRLGLCTNKPQKPAEHALAEAGIDHLFGAVIGGDTVALKPDPAPLLACFARLEADMASAIYVGDSETDAETASNAQVPFALFTGGYRKTAVETLGARFAFDVHDELPPWVLAQR